jgi:hypothetical protein
VVGYTTFPTLYSLPKPVRITESTPRNNLRSTSLPNSATFSMFLNRLSFLYLTCLVLIFLQLAHFILSLSWRSPVATPMIRHEMQYDPRARAYRTCGLYISSFVHPQTAPVNVCLKNWDIIYISIFLWITFLENRIIVEISQRMEWFGQLN